MDASRPGWRPLTRVADALEWLLLAVGTTAFALLVLTVGAQVFARNVLAMGLGWTLDLAQLLFTWCIFLGAAIAVRRRVHYQVDLLPPSWLRVQALLGLIAFAASAVVVYVMIASGLIMIEISGRRFNQALGISGAWFYAAIPVSAAAAAFFLLEQAVTELRRLVGGEPGPA
ncbi:MAG: TRAP transporter small permease subunit [Geminicoccaceae bacterium]|nr:MAG: TRAP transporter small permease subunit [Geminicoccaceae bacterium]